MNRAELQDIKSDIFKTNLENIEELYLIAKYCLETYLESIFAFGLKSDASAEIYAVFKEFKAIISEEAFLHRHLRKKLSELDSQSIYEFLDDLDELNEETVRYYYDVLDDIKDACSLKAPHRLKRMKKDFLTLIESDEYRKRLNEISISFSDICDFFNFPKSFIDYLQEDNFRVILCNHELEEMHEFYGVNIKEEGNVITDFKVFMPIIIDLNTALIASKILIEAYEIYCKRYTPFAEMNNNFDNIDSSISKFKEYVQEKEKALLLS